MRARAHQPSPQSDAPSRRLESARGLASRSWVSARRVLTYCVFPEEMQDAS